MQYNFPSHVVNLRCSVAKSCLTFAIPWTAVHQLSLSFTVSWGLLKLMSIESVIISKLEKKKKKEKKRERKEKREEREREKKKK